MAISLFRHRVSPMTGVAYPGLALNALKGVWVRTSRVFVHYPEESDAVSVAEPLAKPSDSLILGLWNTVIRPEPK